MTTLTGKLVRLEPLGPEHAEAAVAALRSSPADYFALGGVPAPDLAAVQSWIAAAQADAATAGSLPFATIRLADERLVGSSRFWNVETWSWPEGAAFYGRTTPDVCEIGHTWVTADVSGTGINIEAKLLMLEHAFDVWDVHRVFWRTDVRNEASRRAILALGALFEGVRRADKVGADATIRDSAYYSMIRSEWPAARELLQRRLSRHLVD
ncbi:MAG: N-acetyltransferase [Frankiales bacterium]|nr:N-acetyltransferase [Frankiales bacterium]